MMRRLKGIEILILWYAGKMGIRNNPDSSTATRLIDKGYLDEDPDDPDRLIITQHGQHIYQTVMEGNVAHELTEVQLSVLAAGMNQTEFVLTHPQRGSRPQRLVDMGLIEQASKGKYRLTDKGRAAYQETIDPALKPAFEVMDFTASPDAVARVIAENETYKTRIKSLNASLDDMGRLADDLAKKVKTLETATTRIEGEDTADTTARIIVEALLKMKTEDDSHLTLIAYVDDLRQKAATVDQAAMAVEALRRQLDQAHLDLHIAERHAAMHEMDEFLVCVLDELAQADPLIKEHRDSRVTAQRALMQIKDRR